jgi:hypothetical protein
VTNIITVDSAAHERFSTIWPNRSVFWKTQEIMAFTKTIKITATRFSGYTTQTAIDASIDVFLNRKLSVAEPLTAIGRDALNTVSKLKLTMCGFE